MLIVHPEYVIDKDKHPRAVLIPLSEWKQILKELEEIEDIREYDKAKSSSHECIPFDQAVLEIREGYDT